MSYTSYAFCGLVLLGLLFYYGFSGRFQKGVLFLLSLLFLLSAGGLRSVLFLGLFVLVSFGAGLFMEQSSGKRRTAVYVLALCVQLLGLIVFKYLDFLAYTRLALSELRGEEYVFTPIGLAAPLGISFYALMQISYLTDVYLKTAAPAGSLLQYSTYSGLFLHIVQGPIDRYGRLREALSLRHAFSWEAIADGGLRLFWGLFKKLVLSERLAVLVNTVYGDPETFSGSFLIFAACCYSLQLYTDFSGCMDILLGIGRMFGLRLSENFCQPFFSRSDAEFWRRWHITLGNFFRDYLMYPLLRTGLFRRIGKLGRKWFGKKQGKKLPVCLALFIVWSLLGLWHGGMWTFIVGSGLLHCFYMITAEAAEPLTDRFYLLTGLSRENRVWRFFQILRTFVLVSIGFVFFRSDSLTMAFSIFRGMGSGSMALFSAEGYLSLGLGMADSLVLILGLLLLLFVSLQLEKTERIFSVGVQEMEETASFSERLFAACGISRRALVPFSAVLALFLFLFVLILGFYGQGYDAQAFIYSQF